MKRNYKLKSIKSILENFVDQDKISDGIFNVKIKQAWEKAVEKKILDYTKSIYIKGDVLFIEVSNPILKQEILYSRQKVIDLINDDLGKEIVSGKHELEDKVIKQSVKPLQILKMQKGGLENKRVS